MAKGSLGYFELMMNQMNHAQLVMSNPGVEEINRLNLRPASDRLRYRLIVPTESSQSLRSVHATVARNATNIRGFNGIHPLNGALEVCDGQQSLGRPAEDLTSCDWTKLAGRRPGEGFVKHGLSLHEPA